MLVYRHLIETAAALVFPLYCPGCGRQWDEGEGWVCPDCWGSLEAPSGGRWRRDSLLRETVLVTVHYGELARMLVHQMKFRGRVDIARRLGGLAAERLLETWGKEDLGAVVPVPLHPARIRERGYDQNVAIARSAAQRLGLPVIRDLIRRVRNTPPQSRLSDSERRVNLLDAFHPAAAGEPPPGTVLLVDDVIHTGATVRGCIEALRRGGVKNVRVLAICG